MHTEGRRHSTGKPVDALEVENTNPTLRPVPARVDLQRSRVEALQLQVHLATMADVEGPTLVTGQLRLVRVARDDPATQAGRQP